MFTIGDFARHGQVSVRMLRHYDAIGLLKPARVDPHSGYRGYEAVQLHRLNRIVALKDLGFTLDQVGSIIDDKIGIDELRGMLRLRRAELANRLATDQRRLAAVEARLRSIETEGAMPTNDVQVKRVDAVRVAELSAVAEGCGPGEIGPVIGPLFGELTARLEAAGVSPVGPGIAYYDDVSGGGLRAHAAFPVNVASIDGLEIVDLPGIEKAATIVHHGEMANVMPTLQALATWIDQNGHSSAGGYAREVYLEAMGDQTTWVTELQEPLR